MQCSLAYEGSNRFFNDWLAPQQKLNGDDDNNYTSEEGQIFLGASQPLPCLEHKQYLPVPSEQKNQQKKIMIFTYHVELLMDSSLIIYLRNIFGSC